jgi:hypothetical protein
MKKNTLFLIGLFFLTNSGFSQVRVLTDGSLQGNRAGAIRINTGNGYLDLGPKNTSYCEFSTDRTYFSFNKLVQVPNLTLTSSTVKYPSSLNFMASSGAFSSMVINSTTSRCGLFLGPNSPQYTLEVNGIIKGTNLNPLHSFNKSKSQNINTTQIKNLYKLNGISFTYDPSEIPDYVVNKDRPMDEFYNRQHLGFNPDEVEKIFPEMLYRDSLGAPGIIADELLPLIIEALKEQNKLVKSLEKEISSMKSNKKDATGIEVLETSEYSLGQNLPNPFNENTSIEFNIPSSVANASIYIYDLQGKQLKSIELIDRGNGKVIIYGSELQPGMYYYSLIADKQVIGSYKMILTEN